MSSNFDEMNRIMDEKIKEMSKEMKFTELDLILYCMMIQINQFTRAVEDLGSNKYGMASFIAPEIENGRVLGYEYRILSDSQFGLVAEYRKGPLIVDDSERIFVDRPTTWKSISIEYVLHNIFDKVKENYLEVVNNPELKLRASMINHAQIRLRKHFGIAL